MGRPGSGSWRICSDETARYVGNTLDQRKRYEHLGEIGLGTESDAKDKADRLNDKDVEGRYYRAERYL
jgi:hypothetical protein